MRCNDFEYILRSLIELSYCVRWMDELVGCFAAKRPTDRYSKEGKTGQLISVYRPLTRLCLLHYKDESNIFFIIITYIIIRLME